MKKSKKDVQKGAEGTGRLLPTAALDTRPLELLITLSAVLIAFLHLYAAFFPSGVNWGLHHLAFHPLAFKILVPILMVLAVVPGVQRIVLKNLESGRDWFQQLARPAKRGFMLGGIVLMAVVFWSGREATFFLGDALFAQRSLTHIQVAENIPVALQNAPLPGFITWKLYQYLLTQNVKMANQISFQIVSVGIGVISLVVLFRLVQYITQDKVEQTLGYLFILVGGSIQLFFGYVENYTVAFLSVFVFAWLSLAYLRSKVHLVYPSLAFGLMFASHFGLIYLLPAVLVLYYTAFRRGKLIDILVAVAVMIAGTYALLWMCGYSPETVKGIFLKEGGHHFVPLTEKSTGWHAYTMFSLWHLVDRLNMYLLLSPFALLVFLVLAVVHRKQISLKNSPWVFLVLAALFSLAFTVVFNFDIGMSRDWDLLAPYNLGLIIASAFCWMNFVGDNSTRRRMMIVMVLVTLLHTAPWVILNAQEQPSIDRFNMLRDERVWGAAAIIYANEDLGGYYRDRGDFNRAIEYYKQGLAIDSTNSRRWLVIANVYQSLGQENNMIHAFEKAVETGARDAQVHSTLGILYTRHNRIDDAIQVWKKGLSVDPNSVANAYYLGITLADHKHAYQDALPYILRTLQVNPNIPQALYSAGTCYYHLGQREEMKKYWTRFVQLAPNHPEAERIRGLIGSTH